MPRSFSLRESPLASPFSNARALGMHRFLFRFALSGAHIFAWVFIFHYFYLVELTLAHALARIALLFALSQIITCIVTPYAARLLRFGARKVLILASFLAATSFFVLGAAFQGFLGDAYVSTALVLFACGLGFYRAFYWIPYQVEAHATCSGGSVGSGGSGKRNLFGEFLIALTPLIGGVCIVVLPYGPVSLLYICAILIALSMIPILYVRDVHEQFSWGYRETFTQLLEPTNRAIVISSALEGVAGAALLLFWPLTVFLIMGWSYTMLGLVLSLTFVVAILARSFVRKGLRKAGLHASRLVNVIFAVTPWIFRILIATPLGVIFVDSYFYTTTPRRINLDPLVFEQTADAGSFIDEYTALKEIALSLGRMAICAVGAISALALSLPAAFIIVFLSAALASAAVTLAPWSRE